MVAVDDELLEVVAVVVDGEHGINARDVCIDGDGLEAHTVHEHFLTYDGNRGGEYEVLEACLLECVVADLEQVVALEGDRGKSVTALERCDSDRLNAFGNGEACEVVALKCIIGDLKVGRSGSEVYVSSVERTVECVRADRGDLGKSSLTDVGVEECSRCEFYTLCIGIELKFVCTRRIRQLSERSGVDGSGVSGKVNVLKRRGVAEYAVCVVAVTGGVDLSDEGTDRKDGLAVVGIGLGKILEDYVGKIRSVERSRTNESYGVRNVKGSGLCSGTVAENKLALKVSSAEVKHAVDRRVEGVILVYGDGVK